MKTIVFFAIALSVCFAAFAQETGYQPGPIITGDKERIEGLIKNVNLMPARILKNIKFKRSEGEKVTEVGRGSSDDEMVCLRRNILSLR